MCLLTILEWKLKTNLDRLKTILVDEINYFLYIWKIAHYYIISKINLISCIILYFFTQTNRDIQSSYLLVT